MRAASSATPSATPVTPAASAAMREASPMKTPPKPSGCQLA
jgi:hypothetical protein